MLFNVIIFIIEDQDEEVLKVQPCYDREHQIAGQHIASLYVNMRIAEQEQQILEQPVGDLYHISQSELQSACVHACVHTYIHNIYI